jgi:hypothetical protein
MLHSIQQRYGEKIRASDGEIGHVKDFYFDDKNWTLRYLVASTGRWLMGRLVLISPHALGHLYPDGKVLLVNLSRKQIEDSPSIDEHKPVSRQIEEEYHRHYGYPYYAEAQSVWGARYPIMLPMRTIEAKQNSADAHLRSTQMLKGYYVEATNGIIGELVDFMIDARTWMIRSIVVKCGHWYSSKEIFVSTDKVARISYDESTLYLDSKKDALLEVAEQHVAPAGR